VTTVNSTFTKGKDNITLALLLLLTEIHIVRLTVLTSNKQMKLYSFSKIGFFAFFLAIAPADVKSHSTEVRYCVTEDGTKLRVFVEHTGHGSPYDISDGQMNLVLKDNLTSENRIAFPTGQFTNVPSNDLYIMNCDEDLTVRVDQCQSGDTINRSDNWVYYDVECEFQTSYTFESNSNTLVSGCTGNTYYGRQKLMPFDINASLTCASPSDSPSVEPSDQPSDSPSAQPSDQPSDSPSHQPSDSPSAQPSDQPSGSPSTQPSDQPSNPPSDQPSDSPSDQPSDSPSVEPSDQPSDSPSAQPSDKPSDSPSVEPSDQPSDSPSAQSSKQPSDSPSVQPSPTLSAIPSSSPSSFFSTISFSLAICGPNCETIASTLANLEEFIDEIKDVAAASSAGLIDLGAIGVYVFETSICFIICQDPIPDDNQRFLQDDLIRSTVVTIEIDFSFTEDSAIPSTTAFLQTLQENESSLNLVLDLVDSASDTTTAVAIKVPTPDREPKPTKKDKNTKVGKKNTKKGKGQKGDKKDQKGDKKDQKGDKKDQK